jgi:methionyl aminopeptidase
MSRDGDGCLGNGGESNDSDGDGDGDGDGHAVEAALGSLGTPTSPSTETTKKRKKPKKKNKKKAAAASLPTEQSSPPRVPLDTLFPSRKYPEGEVQDYTNKTPRTAAAEARHNTRLLFNDESFLQNYRKAAEVHRQARRWVQETAKPGQTVLSVVEGLEDSVRALLGHAGLETGDCLKAGMGFPTGLCLNHQVAHYTPNPGQKDIVLQQSDLMTLDFGVHINGWIVDSAFTMAFDHTHDALLAAVKDATDTGLRVSIFLPNV